MLIHSWVEQLRNYLSPIETSEPDKNELWILVKITDSRPYAIELAESLFEQFHLVDRDVRKRRKEYVFRIYRQSISGESTVDTLEPVLQKLDEEHIEGILEPYVFGETIS